jgi:hypothetical protein
VIWYNLTRPTHSLQYHTTVNNFTLILEHKEVWQVQLMRGFTDLGSESFTLSLKGKDGLEIAKLRAEEYFLEYLNRTKHDVDSALRYLLEEANNDT